MMDAFERLGLARRAVLDEEVLKAAWIEQGRAVHPDQAGGDAMLSAEMNAAYEVLREPETRLKHLLEVEFPEASAVWATVPMEEELMQVFMKLGPVLQRVEVFAKKKAAATSALAEALLMARAARRLGLEVMLGCYSDSALLNGSAAQLLPLVTWPDLDSHLNLIDDPFDGPQLVQGDCLRAGSGAGLGVSLRPESPLAAAMAAAGSTPRTAAPEGGNHAEC
jgi:curved DNA-binding protein CbpA